MENKTFQTAIMISLLLSLSGCEIIGTIFKTGMGVGVIIVVLIIAVGIYLYRKMGTK